MVALENKDHLVHQVPTVKLDHLGLLEKPEPQAAMVKMVAMD